MQLQEVSNVAVIVGENAVTVSQLPSVWQDIAKGRANVRFRNPQIYVEMAQLFQYKLQYGDVDLFNERPHLFHLIPSFSELFGQLAKETLEFYGHDFMVHNYPNFGEVLHNLESKGSEFKKKTK